MDKDKNARLDFDEFVTGSKLDPTIVKVGGQIRSQCRLSITTIHLQALSLYDGLV